VIFTPRHQGESKMSTSQTYASFADDLAAERPALERFAWRRARRADLVDDLVQETMLRAWAHRDKFQEGTNLSAWLYTILRNTHISFLRKSQREQVGLEEGWEQSMATPASQQDHLDLMEVAKAIGAMPADQRDVLISAGVEGRPHSEIAAQTGCALGTVRSRLSRARVRLNAMLDGEDLPDGQDNLPLAA